MTTPIAAPIVLVEDDANDVRLARAAIERTLIANPLLVFAIAADVRRHFTATPSPGAPALFMLDIYLPGSDSGLDLLHWIRRHDSAFGATPTMILTGSTRHEDRIDSDRLGAICFLQKPLTEVTLVTAIKALGFAIVAPPASGANGLRMITRR